MPNIRIVDPDLGLGYYHLRIAVNYISVGNNQPHLDVVAIRQGSGTYEAGKYQHRADYIRDNVLGYCPPQCAPTSACLS